MIAPVSGPVDLRGRIALVSGAARGIGRAICAALGRDGTAVACADVLDVSETTAALSAMGAKAIPMVISFWYAFTSIVRVHGAK